MAVDTHRPARYPRRRVNDPGKRLTAPLAAAAFALAPVVAMRGFTVDDAWIPARYAAHIASGVGYRFNAGGAATDGVTPLPWAPILAVLSGGDVSRAFSAARIVGVVAWALAAAVLGHVARTSGERPLRFAPLLVLGVSAPLAAWSVGGLETGLVTLLVTLAAAAGDDARGRGWGAGAAGAAAAFRPEMLPLAVVLGAYRGRGLAVRPRVVAMALATGPWLAVALLRVVFFGRPAPLSQLAKPSDLAHGVPYVVAGLLLAGAPILAFAPVALVRGGDALARARWLVVAASVHALAVAFAGGDWMPLSRLLVPAFPLLIVAAIDVAERAPAVLTAVRAALALAVMVFAWARGGLAARDVLATRMDLLQSGRIALSDAGVIAALDVGWIGAATSRPIVDLAGLTDPAVAALPGGHTSKRVPTTLLDARAVDTLVFLRRRDCTGTCVRSDGGPFDRVVEERLSQEPWVADGFRVGAILRSGPLTYVVLRRR